MTVLECLCDFALCLSLCNFMNFFFLPSCPGNTEHGELPEPDGRSCDQDQQFDVPTSRTRTSILINHFETAWSAGFKEGDQSPGSHRSSSAASLCQHATVRVSLCHVLVRWGSTANVEDCKFSVTMSRAFIQYAFTNIVSHPQV